MIRFTKKELSVIQRYMTGSKYGIIVSMKAALPFMNKASQDFFASVLAKVEKMTEIEFYSALADQKFIQN